jgi:hypothetical protein
MEPISTIIAAAAGYILKAAAQSKTALDAREEILGKFWRWIRSRFIKEIPAIQQQPDSPETADKIQERLLELINDEHFFKELQQQVTALRQAGIKEKNIVKKDIINVKRIRIGDREYTPDEQYDRKNIAEGNIENADEFILGDGH